MEDEARSIAIGFIIDVAVLFATLFVTRGWLERVAALDLLKEMD